MSRRWTDEEYGIIQDSDGIPAQTIAEGLGRSVGSVHHVRSKIRNGWKPVMPYWSPLEDLFLAENREMTAMDVAVHLSRTPRAVEQRRTYLRHSGIVKVGFAGNFSPFKPAGRPLLAQTCKSCGLLLQAMWFERDSKANGWTKKCRPCHAQDRPAYVRKNIRSQHSQSHKMQQIISMKTATNTGNPWVESDFAVLRNPDMTLLEKALTLRRTYGATQSAAFKSGCKSKIGLGDPERDQWIIDNPNTTRIEEITELLKASPAPEATPTHPKWDWDDKETA